jgi:hypothetical protein
MRAALRWSSFALIATAGCASAGAAVRATPRPSPDAMPSMPAGTKCDPADYATRPAPDRHAIDSAFSVEPRLEEMRLILHAPQAKVRQKVAAAMLACKIPLTQSSADVIEARYGKETGFLAQYNLVTHANIVALDDSTTLVRLAGQEDANDGYSNNTRAISNKNQGRSLQAWIALRNVAKQLRADPSLHADISKSTELGFVYAR